MTPDAQRIMRIPHRSASHALPGGAWDASWDVNPPTLGPLERSGNFKLRPDQARAITEVCCSRGGIVRMGVGRGKSLVLLALPTAMGVPQERVAWLTQASLKRALLEEHAKWKSHFYLANPERGCLFTSHEWLGQPQGEGALRGAMPQLIIIDEATGFASWDSYRTVRLVEYVAAARKADLAAGGDGRWPAVVLASGTILRRRLMELRHLGFLAMADRSPVPHDVRVAMGWECAMGMMPGAVMGQRLQFDDDPAQMAPGMNPLDMLAALLETPVGIARTTEAAIPTNLRWTRVEGVPLDPAVMEATRTVLQKWEAPDGRELHFATERALLLRQLGSGFYLKRHPTDGVLEQHSVPVPVFISTAHVERACADFFREGPGIAWFLSPHAGARVASALGVPWWGAGDADGILDAARTGEARGCASILAHGTGKNLQKWARMLVCEVPASAALWEQLVGRMHRNEQAADTVDVFVAAWGMTSERAFLAARKSARQLERATRDAQKLLCGDWTNGAPEDVDADELATALAEMDAAAWGHP